MGLYDYLFLRRCLQNRSDTPQARRAFYLSLDKTQREDNEALFSAWFHAQCDTAPVQKLKRYDTLFFSLVSFASFLFGYLTGYALLYYDGSRPINFLWYLIVAAFLPLLSVLLSANAMLVSPKSDSGFGLFHLVQALFFRFGAKALAESIDRKESRVLLRYLFVRFQRVALWFSVGIFASLLIVVLGKDIAFVWSTTLQVDAHDFYRFVRILAAPWAWCCPDALPSQTLVEQSRYFRLGGKVSETMLSQASLLGAWWKFLALSVLSYAIFPRLLLLLWGYLRYRRTLRHAIDNDTTLALLLEDMRHAHADFNTGVESAHRRFPEARDGIARHAAHYDLLLVDSGVEKEAIAILGIQASEQVAWTQTQEMQAGMRGKRVVFLVEGWDAPTAEKIDEIGRIAEVAGRIDLLPVGLREEDYRLDERQLRIWQRLFAKNERVRVVA